jgi:hypothetical protein
MKKALDSYNDHKEGTEYDNEEVPEHLKSIRPNLGAPVLTILKVDNVNHKPDMFCITGKHMILSKGMYLDPNVAPCGNCGEPYSNHTSERAMFVRPLTEDKDLLGKTLKEIADLCAAEKIKLDGFAFVK